MEAIKCYLAASDIGGVHVYRNKPCFNQEFGIWEADGLDPAEILGFLNRRTLLALGIDPKDAIGVPIEVCIVVSYDAK